MIFSNTARAVLLLALLACVYSAGCPGDCSSRGLCVNGKCQCAEGLTGNDCSQEVPATSKNPYNCPSCYDIVVGPPILYLGPSYRLPDGPIVGLNYKGNLSIYVGNGNFEMQTKGPGLEDWLPSPITTLTGGTDFDSCGAWLMRTFTEPSGLVRGFYHAERECNYANNGQTRKSCGYSESADGLMFTKPNYPNNKIIDTASPTKTGMPTGQGDFGLVVDDFYFYITFNNVEKNYIGLSRATRASGGVPGSWYNYYNGKWTEPGIGGLSTSISNIAGTQTYYHAPSRTYLSVGKSNAYYWGSGIGISASVDMINWTYMADPLVTGDMMTNSGTILYQSLLGPTGGADVGSEFQLFYMYSEPGKDLNTRYQIRRSVTFNLRTDQRHDGQPSTIVALTTNVNQVTGERWEGLEYAPLPYRATRIMGYMMTRQYPNTFVIYDCFRTATGDHFVGTGPQCLGVSGVTAYRALGYIWASRMPNSIVVYSCTSGTDSFLSPSSSCDGLASSQNIFGYLVAGPPLSTDITGRDILLTAGSTWTFSNKTAQPATWMSPSYSDSNSNWTTGKTPFGNGYSNSVTYFGFTAYYFRKTVTVAAGKSFSKVLIRAATDNYAIVWINGKMVDQDSGSHEAGYWNRQVYVDPTVFTEGSNLIAVQVPNMDSWAFFDMQIEVIYASAPAVQPVCNPVCVHGNCASTGCQCDMGWSGKDCNTNLCTYSGTTMKTLINTGSFWNHQYWQSMGTTPPLWAQMNFDDSTWDKGNSSFGTWPYRPTGTWINAIRRLFRKTFTISVPNGQVIQSAVISVASDDNHRVHVNGKMVGADIYPIVGHNMTYWNDIISVDPSLFINGNNIIAVEIPLLVYHSTIFFDLQLNVTFGAKTCAAQPPTDVPTPSPSSSSGSGYTSPSSSSDSSSGSSAGSSSGSQPGSGTITGVNVNLTGVGASATINSVTAIKKDSAATSVRATAATTLIIGAIALLLI